jgi:hypothetical protein
MDSSKLKNIIIIVLLIINLVFAGMLVSSNAEGKSSSRQARESLAAVLQNKGITLADDVDISQEAPAEYSLRRDLDSEESAVRKLLGSCTAYDQGGNVYFYSCNKGDARFRGTGEIEIVFDSCAVPTGNDAVSSAMKAAKKLGIETVEVSDESDGDVTSVRLAGCFRGSEIFNSRIEFTFSKDDLLLLVGQRPFDTVVGKTDSQALDCATAIMRFVQLMDEQGVFFSEITEVSAGYVTSVSVSGGGVMTPAWRIKTDSGVYCINAVTGREETLPE